MIPTIAVPYFPGSNGDYDAVRRIKEFGMKPLPLYFHMGDEQRLHDNARRLAEEANGAVLPGGFSYEDRIDFGRVAASIPQFREAMRDFIASGRPVLGFCNGNQIAHMLGILPAEHNIRVLTNICDRDGELVHDGFLDGKLHVQLTCDPQRTAFTQHYSAGEVIPSIIDHGGGRFWTSKETLQYLLDNDLIVTRYCAADGTIEDNFPINPNGSMLNIEAITNPRGNIKIGMCHDERKLNALGQSRANHVFESMRQYILDGCPDLSRFALQGGRDIPITLKDYGYLSRQFDPAMTATVYVRMLTDDNERMTSQLFLNGMPLERRRMMQLELTEQPTPELLKQILVAMASFDSADAIMLKKDVPAITAQGLPVLQYEVVNREPFTRDFRTYESPVPGMPVTHQQIPAQDPHGNKILRILHEHEFLRRTVRDVHSGRTWFFANENDKKTALESLLEAA